MDVEITFDLVDTKVPDGDFMSHSNPCVGIKLDQPLIDYIINADEIVIPLPTITVEVDYPLSRSFIFPLTSTSPLGFTRKDLVFKVSTLYKWIYQKEEDTSDIRPALRKESLNRNTTNGYFCIWGHELSDLELITIKYIRSRGTYYVHIDS